MDLQENSSAKSSDHTSAMDEIEPESTLAACVVTIHPAGDAIIIAKSDDIKAHFIVSSQAFALVCEPWNAMVKYRATMGEQKSTHQMEFTLEDDDWGALEVVLRIAHLQFNKLSELDLEDVLDLALLTDKYQATAIVGPWISGWLEKTWKKASIKDRIQNFWIAWEYGLLEDLKDLGRTMIMGTELNEDCTTLLFNRKPLPENLPPGLAKSIFDSRAHVIAQLTQAVRNYALQCFRPGKNISFCLMNINACDMAICGSLVRGLQDLNLYPPESAHRVTRSVLGLSAALKNLRIFNSEETSSSGGYKFSHDACNPKNTIRERVTAIVTSEVPSALMMPHLTHLQRQRSLLGLPK
ncbi:unnamed protein product [Zymoseptoria tritici ST99CH_3D1]|nr:unnamed protein product [Zymoseptoria tritici ST99CH_3D1]